MEQLTFSTFDLARINDPRDAEDEGRRCRHDRHPELCDTCESILHDAETLENDQ